jgi:hypothetical protein
MLTRLAASSVTRLQARLTAGWETCTSLLGSDVAPPRRKHSKRFVGKLLGPAPTVEAESRAMVLAIVLKLMLEMMLWR